MEEYKGYIDDKGQVRIHDHPRIVGALLKWQEKELVISISQNDSTRSQAQNRWYWGVAIQTIISDWTNQTGQHFTKDEVHGYILSEVLKAKFRSREMMGKTVLIFEQKSTKNMGKKEFNRFKDVLQQYFLQNYDIDIPDPVSDNFVNDHEHKRNSRRSPSRAGTEISGFHS